MLNNLIELFDTIVIGGAMANTFLLANNYAIGKSLAEKELVNTSKEIQINAINFGCNILLPVDLVCSININDKDNIKCIDIGDIPNDKMILDVGEKTIKLITKEILKSKMLLWNGPLGAFEFKPFDEATMKVAHFINHNAKKFNIEALAGGGDTISSIKSANAENGFSYISNAGGAFLEWLEGKQSPGIIALKENDF